MFDHSLISIGQYTMAVAALVDAIVAFVSDNTDDFPPGIHLELPDPLAEGVGGTLSNTRARDSRRSTTTGLAWWLSVQVIGTPGEHRVAHRLEIARRNAFDSGESEAALDLVQEILRRKSEYWRCCRPSSRMTRDPPTRRQAPVPGARAICS